MSTQRGSVGSATTALGLSVPVCCFRSPTGQKDLVGLLLQPDGIPHRRCPPTGAGAGVVATTGTNHHAATAPVGRLNNGGMEQGPLGLDVPRLPRDMVSRRWELNYWLPWDCQESDTHNTFGSAKSYRHPPPPPEPTHHQMVLCWQLRPSSPTVQLMQPQIRRRDCKVDHRTAT